MALPCALSMTKTVGCSAPYMPPWHTCAVAMVAAGGLACPAATWYPPPSLLPAHKPQPQTPAARRLLESGDPISSTSPTPAPSSDEVGCCCTGLEHAVFPTVLFVLGMHLLLIMCAARPAVPDGKTLRCRLHHQTPPAIELLVLAAEYIGVAVWHSSFPDLQRVSEGVHAPLRRERHFRSQWTR